MAGFSPEDFDYAVRTVWGEARGENPFGQQAVAHVIRNRANKSGLSIRDTVLAKNQFEPWGARRSQLEALKPDSPEYQRIAEAIRPVFYENTGDPTSGATHFYSPKAQTALGRKPPSWDDGSGVDIGRHRFFALGSFPGAAPSPSRVMPTAVLAKDVPDLFPASPGKPPMADPTTDFTTIGLSPEEVARRRQLANQAYTAGSDISPVGHWTQALARAVQGMNAGVWGGQAQKGEAEGRAAANAALTRALTSSDPVSAVAAGLRTPYGTETFGPMASNIVAQKISESGDMYKAKLEATRAESEAKRAEARKAGYVMTPPGYGMTDIRGPEPKTVMESKVKPPPGYEYDPANPTAMRPTPGGPADIKFTEAKNKALTGIEGTRSRVADLTNDIDAVISHPGLKGNFGLKGALPNVPGSQAADAWALIQQLKARGSFSILQQMREMSKTGGALGAVSDAENAKLERSFAALEKSQSAEQTVRELVKVKEQLKRTQAIMDLAYRRQYGEATPAETPSRAAPSAIPGEPATPTAAPKPGDVMKGYRFRGGDPSKPESWEKVAP